MCRNLKWGQSSTNICPLCQKEPETVAHIFQCKDSRARTCRSIQIIELKNKLKAVNTSPFIINHLCRILFQFFSQFPISVISIPINSTEEQRLDYTNMNQQITMGAEQLLSGFLCYQISQIQNRHIQTSCLSRKSTLNSWNRTVIKAFLDFSQAVWKSRSDILHNEAAFTREAMLREQAVILLTTLRFTPHRLPNQSRNLLNRTKSYLQTSHLKNVVSWTKRVNRALEEQSYKERSTSNDIRTWLYSGRILSCDNCGRVEREDDGWYDPHSYDSDDSEMTVNYKFKFPDEEYKTWEPYCARNIDTTVTNKLIAPK